MAMPEKVIFSGVVHLGISDHSLIYTIRKINTRPNTKSQGFVEFQNFKISMMQHFWMTCIVYLGKTGGSCRKHFLYRCWINMPIRGKKIKGKGQCSLGK
jgi:hypothetical protein